jgi:TPR repeat protein
MWHQRAADQGYAPAWNNLGLCYRNGEGVPQDEIRAAGCFRRAAELGNDSGQYNLGRCYFHGVGVIQDIEQAKFWIGKAAAQGYKNAQLFMQDNNWQ